MLRTPGGRAQILLKGVFMLNAPTVLCEDWSEDSFRLITLMAMLRAKAESFCRSLAMMGQCITMLKAAEGGHITIGDSVVLELGRSLLSLKKEAETLELRSTLQQIERIEKTFQDPRPGGLDELRRLLLELEHRFTDELESMYFLSVSFSHVPYYEQKLRCSVIPSAQNFLD